LVRKNVIMELIVFGTYFSHSTIVVFGMAEQSHLGDVENGCRCRKILV
jgi:hypothetical protein